nr:VacJ family lipoprotein [uncultured Pseudodesulfovibrio sp.]
MRKTATTALQCILVFSLLSLLGACGAATTTHVDPALTLPVSKFQTTANHWPKASQHGLNFMEVNDPWEPLNRHLYDFNAGFDEYFMLPVTSGYEAVLPSPIRSGISNLIQNVNELPTLVNCMLQGKIEKSAITSSRFLINSTFGLAGIMDLASDNPNFTLQKEDFGQTLGVWGFGNGPYFVMPIFGPSNVRDTFGFGGDFMLVLLQMKHTYRLLGVNNPQTVGYAELALRALNRRSNTAFRYHGTGSPFEYEMIRFIYTKKRELDIRH